MKNFNFIKRLWVDSHEKHLPQRFGHYAAMLFLFLTLGVGQMWAATATLYIDIENANWAQNSNSIYVWDSSKKKNIKFSYVSTNLYKSDEEVTQGITLYFKQTANNNPDTKYNEASGTYNGTNNCFRLSGWTSGSFSYNISKVSKTNYIYFNNATTGWTNTYKYFVIGHDEPTAHSKVYALSSISNTKLLYVKQDANDWSDVTYYGFNASNSTYSNGSWGTASYDDAAKYVAPYKDKYDMNSGSSYYCVPSSATNNKAFTITYKDGYGSIPKLNATQSAKKRDTGTSYTEVSGTYPATLSLQGTYLSGNGTSSQSSISRTKSSDGSDKSTYGTVVTGLVTHSYSSLSDSYYFEGWGTGSTPSVTTATHSYNISAATTTYAFFSKLYTLTYGRQGSYGTSSLSVSVADFSGTTSSGSSIPTGHTITFTASPASGYAVEGWYSDAECTPANRLQSRGTTYTISSLDANTTVYCKFVATKNITVYIYVGGCTSDQINSIELFGTPYVGSVALDAVHYYIGDFTIDGNWRKYTFTNVSEVQSLVVARSGGRAVDNITATADVYAKWDGTALDGKCVSAPSLTWTTAPANGTAGEDMTAVVNTTAVSGGSPSITWTSSDDGVATVSNGVITYVAAGTATITAAVSWSATGDYCAGSQNLAQAITVSAAIVPTISAASFTNNPILTWEWVKISFTYANIPDGAYYRIKGGAGYYRDKNNLTNIPISGDGTENFEAACDQVNMLNDQTWVVEIYNSSNAKITERTVGNLSVTNQAAELSSITLSPNTTQNYAGSPIDITMSVTSKYVPNPVVIFYVADNSNSTTYEVVATTGAIGDRTDYSTTHTATFSASHAATYSVTAKVFAGLLLANWDGKDFSGGGGWFNNNGGHAKVANPAIQANNASATVQSFTKGTNWWDVPLYWLTTTDADKTGYNYRYIHTRQYSAQSGKPELKVSNYKGNLTTGDSFSANQWCKLTYDNYKDGSERVDFFMPLFENGNTTVYIDDIILSTEASMTARATQSTAASVTIRDVYNITYLDEGGASFSGIHEDTPSEHPTTHTYGTATDLNTATKTGYTFGGWYTTSACTGGAVTSLGATAYSDDITLYAKWTANTYTVTFNPRGGSGLTPTSKEVTMGAAYGTLATVTPPAGYIFDGWYTSSAGGTKVTNETLVETASDHTLYAHYVQKAQVYFKNTLGWSKVYVTYDAYWDSGDPSKGSGNNGKTTHLMTLVAGTTDIYYDDIPDAILNSWKGSIVFYNEQQVNYNNFNKGQAVFRRDFDSDATMFVPVPNDPNKFTLNAGNGAAGTTYYSTDQVVDKSGDDVTNYRYKNGYWVRYNNVEAGYSLKGSWDAWAADHYIAKETASGTTYTYTIRGLSANTTYFFKLFKHCATSNTYSSQFSNTGTMTDDNCSNWTFDAASTTGNAGIKTTVAGDYTFNFTFGDGEVKLSVEYPFKKDDYKVIYSYTKDGAKTYESEIIKCRANGLDTISVFIHSSSDASSRSLKIAKCTGINASGVSTWNNSYATIDISSVSESGVYNFIITQDGSAAATGAYWNKYTGNYYIRTAASDGGWDMYKYRPNNIMTLSEYSLTQTLSAPYSHYYCRYIESTTMDITYAVATDYSPNISGILVGDATIGGDGNKTLPASANVRFTYNENTNALRRAYLKSAQGSGNTRFLVLHGKANEHIFNANGTAIAANPSQSLEANELLFSDLGNWVYQVELQAKPGAKVSLIARYNGETSTADRYLIGSESSWMEIMGGDGTNQYDILAVFDFKTNRLMTVWTPGGPIGDALEDVDMLLVRHAQDDATSVTFSGSGSLTTKKVYGAIKLDYNELVGHVASWTTDSRPLLKYMISFPFDVNISDVFGLNTRYGDAYVIQKYDGADRAARGFFRGDGTTTFWKDMEQNEVMRANVGYCVIFDNDYLNGDLGAIWENKSAESSVYLYFPSAGNVGAIASSTKGIEVTALPCNIDREFTVETRTLNHKYTDSNWNLIGVPIFQNSTGVTSSATITYPENTGNQTGSYGPFYYFYDYDVANNRYSIASAAGYNFKTMYSYMLQYAGTVTFTGSTPSSVAARRIADTKKYEVELQVLNNDEEVINRAFVNLKENACDTFALNEDVYMSPNSAAVNIYTLAGNYDVAANILSIDNHIVPVGVEVSKAGNYSFSMPSDFDGTVVLVDNFDGSRTDLSLGDYSVALPKGTIEDRFTLEINIERSSATDIEGIEGGTIKDGKAHKFVRDGILYILRDGVIYDAMGKRVK